MVTSCNHYNECGCEVSACCLDCPLPVCKFEFKQGMKTVSATLKSLRISHFLDEGRSMAWIMQVMGVSRRTVYRAKSDRNSVTDPLTLSVRRATMNVEAIAASSNRETSNAR
ncbi:hypothetical protein LCGC14_2203210 [marine sediment metagenome]|uniref:Resolvase HTH domain-containing protein n=1 Tax=marine sediment metagenome TaxID=412755 RepID=A0A0F9DG69_9ZZZZ